METTTESKLERVRREVNPTRRGQQVCAEVMAEMLKMGWQKDQLDELEILFWRCRDRHGNVR